MGPTGRLVTIKRSGVDGPHFPLSLSTCLFGRGIECDIRIQLPVVSKQHCKIEISGQKATLFNFSATNPTQVNGSVIDEPVQLKHGDMITIVDRSFRYENESQTTEFPGQRREQVSSHQGTRSDFSSDPDGNVQDPNARSEVTEEGVSGPVGVSAAHGIPRASGEPGARKTPDVPSSALPGDDGKNAAGPTAGEFREDSSVTSVSGSGELTRPSTRCLEKCGENESPFRKLYESLKEELDVKSEKENVLQNRRRSGSRSHRTTDNGSAGGSQGAAQLRVSPKPGRRSGLRSQSEAGSASGDRGRGRTEARRTDAGPAQMPRDAVGPRVAPRELTKSESPAPCLQQNSSRPGPGGDRSRGGDSMSLGPQVSLGAGGGLSAPERILTRTQTQTATRDDGADKSRNTPEKALSKKRRSSVPVNTDMLAVDTDTQAPAPLSPLRAQAERKVPDGPLSTPEPLDVSNSAEDVNKMEGVPSKRRRVSFGGHLRPELFDENLPPNTPLKRGETPTKRRSLGTHTPAVLKKIIKEQPLPSGKDDTSEIRLGTPAQNALPSLPARTPTGPAAAHTHGARPLPSGPPCAQGTDLPRSGGRRSSGRPPRPSVGRSQLELLQAIHSKRRSGASEANLIVAKSWADVVRLSAKQAQTKVAKRSAQRPPSKRQRRSNTPKKPVGSVHHPSSTGHANSPCTIVIGKAHLEKVNAPARPCRMLNSFIFSRKADFNEDLSGLTEMFKTPAKEKVQMTSICPTTFSNSEDLLRKMFAVPSSEEETLLRTAKNSGETVSPSTRNAPEEPSEKSSINPAFRRQRLIVNGEMGRAPPEAEPLRPASSAHKLRRSAELGNAQTPGAEGEHGVTEASAVEDTWGGRFGRTPSREQKPEGELKESARSFETCRKSNRSEENSEKAAAARRSRALELRRALRPEDPVALGRPHDTDPAGARGSHGPLRSPAHPKEPGDTESRTATVGSQPPEPEPFRTPAQGNMQVKTPSQKVSVEVLSAQRKRPHTPGESTNTPREPEGDEKDVTACEDTPEQKRNPAEHAPGSRRRPRTPKRKVQALEDLAGFTELLQTPDPTLEPVTDDKINNIPCRSPQVDPVITSTVMTRGLKTLLQKVDVEEALLALRKSPRAPGKTTCSPREPAGDEKVIEFFQATPELKPDPAENAAGSRRRPRTPKRKVQHLEDLAGFRELFQTPKPLVEPVTDVKTKTPCKSPQAEPVITSTVMTGWLKTPPCKVDVDVEEALSALRKSPRIPRGTTCSPREPADDEKITKAFKATPEQKLELTENVTGSRRRPRTPKRKAQALEELAGFRELLQTPDRTVDAMTEVKTRTPCKSPQAEPVTMPTGRKSHLKTSLGKVEMDEDISALRNPTPTPGETTHSHGEAGGDDKDISHLKQTPEQKVDPAENAAGSKRRPRTPKRREQPLEELAGFTELLQTPDCTLEPVTYDKTQIPCRSPQVDPVITSTIVTKGLKTLLQKVDVEEALLALRKSPRAPGGTTCSPREPAGDEKVIEFFQATPEQKLDPAENAAGSRRRPRTPKRKVQHLEDLAGFRELFQSPDRTLEPVTDVKTKTPCKSPQAEPVTMPTGRKSRLKTSLGKVDVEEDISALKNPTPTPGETTHSHREAEGDDKDISHLKQTPEQKVDPVENAAGSKRRPRTPKRRVQSLGDLTGFRELFQSPDRTVASMTDDKSNNIPSISPKPEPINTNRKSHLKTPLEKVDIEEELSAPRKPMPTPGGPSDDKEIKVFKATPEQKLDPAENAARSKRRPRTPKRKVQSLGDLTGFRELFQTPDRTLEPMTDVKTKIPCRSPQAEPLITSTVMTRGLKTLLQKVDVEEALSALRKSPRAPGGTTYSPREPAGDEKITKAFKATPEQKVDPAENAARSKRRPRTPKRKVQSLGDLTGFTELLQTSDCTLEPVTYDKTQIPCRSPQVDPVITSTIVTKGLKTLLQKVDVEEALLALRKSPRAPGGTTCSPREPAGDEKVIEFFQATPEQKLDPAENAAGSRRRPRTPKRKVQHLEDLAGFRELFQTPDRTLEPVTDVKTKTPCKSPQAEPVTMSTGRKSRLKTSLGKVDVEEDISALRNPTPTPGETTHSHREAGGDDKDISHLTQTPEQKVDPAENAARSKRRPRTPKRRVQSLGDLTGFRELFQSPDRTLEPMTDVKTKIPCRSPQAGPLITSTVMTRGLKTLLQKVDVEEALSALRKSPRAPGGTTYSPREPAGDEKITKAFKATPEQKLELTENVTGSRRRPRTPKGKAQALEDLAGIEELFRTPDHTVEPVTDDKTKILCRSPRGEPINTSTSKKSHLKTPLEKVDIEEEPLAPRKPTPTPGGTTDLPREPGDDKDIRAFKATPEQKLELTEIVIGSKRKPRTPKGKAQALEDLAGIEELFRTPDRTVAPVTDDKAQIPCKSPQAEPAGRKKRLKAPPGKVDIEVEPSALKKPTRTSRKTTSSHREPKGDDEDIKLFKKTSEQKADSAENVTRSKRRPRAPKEMARAVGDLAGLVEPFQTSDHTDGPGTDDRAAKTLRQSSRPELGIRAASKKRQGKAPTREEDVEEEEEPAAPRKSTRTSGKTTRSHRAAVGGNKKASVSQQTVAQNLGPAGNAVGSRRRLRTRTEQPPPPEDRPGCQELIAAPGQDEAPGSDAESARRDPAPTRDKRKPAKTSRRVPRALSVEPTEDPARSPNGSVSRSPTREHGKDENLAGAKRLRTRTCPQDAAEDPPLQKRQRTAPRDRRPPPGPAVTDRRSQRLLAERTDLPSSTVSVKNKRQKAEVMAPPEKSMSLRSRRPNKTSGVEQGPGFTSAEKAPTRRNVKKTPNTSQEMKLRNLEDGAEDPAPGGQAQGGGARLRPGRQRRVPAGAAGEAGDSRAGIHGDAREEKEGAKRSGRGCLRPRKVAAPPAGDTLESEPKQRVTRSAKRSAESLTKENDNVCVRKMRTRSHRDNEDI